MYEIIVEKWAGTNNISKLIWRSIRIKKSLDNICHTLELELPISEHTKVHIHDMLKVRYGHPSFDIVENKNYGFVTTVLVDEITINIDTKNSSMLVIGRSPARDIIDSTWSDGRTSNADRNVTLLKLTQYIASRFCRINTERDISCGGDTDFTKPVPQSFTWQNESPWMKLLAEADNQGFIITANEAGGLYIWNLGRAAQHEGFSLTEKQNIKTIEWKKNGAEQYREYVVNAGTKSEKAEDWNCPDGRILTIDLTEPILEPEKIKRRAQTERRRRMETRLTVTVSGWGITDAQIDKLGKTLAGREIFWGLNFIIPVSIPALRYQDNLLIAEVEFEASVASVSSTITLVNKAAYE